MHFNFKIALAIAALLGVLVGLVSEAVIHSTPLPYTGFAVLLISIGALTLQMLPALTVGKSIAWKPELAPAKRPSAKRFPYLRSCGDVMILWVFMFVAFTAVSTPSLVASLKAETSNVLVEIERIGPLEQWAESCDDPRHLAPYEAGLLTPIGAYVAKASMLRSYKSGCIDKQTLLDRIQAIVGSDAATKPAPSDRWWFPGSRDRTRSIQSKIPLTAYDLCLSSPSAAGSDKQIADACESQGREVLL